MKICIKCKVEKELNLFYKNNNCKDGLYHYCKECHKEKRKESYQKNKEKTLISTKEWYSNNKEKMKKHREENNYKLKQYQKKRQINDIKKKYFNYYLNNKKEIDCFFNNKEINNDNVLDKIKEFKRNKSIIKRKNYIDNWKKNNNKYFTKYIKQRNKEDKIFKFTNSLRTLICSSFKRGSFNYVKKTKTEFILGCTILEFRNYIESKFTEGMSFQNHGKWHLDHIIPLASATTEEEVIKLNHYTNFQPLWAFDNRSKGCKIL
jgi:hypothetical protein